MQHADHIVPVRVKSPVVSPCLGAAFVSCLFERASWGIGNPDTLALLRAVVPLPDYVAERINADGCEGNGASILWPLQDTQVTLLPASCRRHELACEYECFKVVLAG